jgi:hypothetical protein
MLRRTLISLVLAFVAVSAHANDDRTRTIIGAGLGAAVGAAIGSELGGRNEAILGGAIGGAIGTVIAAKDRHDHYPRYRRPDRHDSREIRCHDVHEREHVNKRKHRDASFCPPGLAMQSRC